jgi:hypothetical protein
MDLKMRLLEQTPNPKTGVLLREERGRAETQRMEWHHHKLRKARSTSSWRRLGGVFPGP